MQDSCQVFSFPWLELFLHESRVKTLLFLYYSIHDKNKLVKGVDKKVFIMYTSPKTGTILARKKVRNNQNSACNCKHIALQ